MKSYDLFAETFSKSRNNMKWPELDAIIQDISHDTSLKILDVGCGNGRFLESYFRIVGEFPQNYLGIDSSPKMIQEAQKKFPNHRFLHYSMQEISNILESFDIIIFLASFHHLEKESDRIQVLRDTKKILNKNGKIFFTNWNLGAQKRYQKFLIGDNDYSIKIGEFYRYYHGFSVEEFEKLFLECGYDILKNEIFVGGRNIFSVIQ